ncbi:MAG TPA: S8/S53 family peptidase [Longimicrobium sp.]|nr:S8/S53 family peptidase [Longimicrobium sp.]
MRSSARMHFALALAAAALAACADAGERITAVGAPESVPLAARQAEVDTSRFTRRFRAAGGGPVFVRLTGAPGAAALARLQELGLGAPQGRLRPEVFDAFNTVWGVLPAGRVKALASLPWVERVESSDDEDGIFFQASSTPVNSYASEIKWNLHRVRAPEMWRDFEATGERQLSATGWQSAGIWIIDDGLDYRLHRYTYTTFDWDKQPINEGNFTTDPTAVHLGTHGTAVGSFAAAEPNNDWTAGVAPRAWLRIAKGLPSGTDWGPIVSSLNAAYTNGPTVINMSLGNCGATPPTTVRTALQRLANRTPADAGYPGVGVSIVAAGGNGLNGGCTHRNVPYPAAYPEVIAVAAIDVNNATNSNYAFGSKIELAAPGLCVDALAVGGGVNPCISGTSFAAPHVAGVIAAIRAKHNNLSAAYVRTRLQQTATKLPGQTLPRDTRVGFGLVNGYAVLQAP